MYLPVAAAALSSFRDYYHDATRDEHNIPLSTIYLFSSCNYCSGAPCLSDFSHTSSQKTATYLLVPLHQDDDQTVSDEPPSERN